MAERRQGLKWPETSLPAAIDRCTITEHFAHLRNPVGAIVSS
jgi:hypothetical protein